MRGAVLAGGAASRYGGAPKGLVTVGGRRILDRVIDSVQTVTGSPPLLIANAPDAASWRADLRTVPDTRPGFGSLGGIYTAVVAAPGPVLCVAWDMPFVPDALLQKLTEGTVPVVLVSLGGPYLLANVPKAAAYLAAFSPTVPSELSARRIGLRHTRENRRRRRRTLAAPGVKQIEGAPSICGAHREDR